MSKKSLQSIQDWWHGGLKPIQPPPESELIARNGRYQEEVYILPIYRYQHWTSRLAHIIVDFLLSFAKNHIKKITSRTKQ